MRLFLALVLGASLSTPAYSYVPQQAPPTTEKPSQAVFPNISADALNKKHLNLPKDFGGHHNLLLLSFEREQEKEIETWSQLSKDLQKADASFRTYILPVFTRENVLYRWWENSSLRSDVNDPELLDVTVPLYVDKARFRKDLQIASEHQIVALLVDDTGKVIWRSEGPLTDEKKSGLLAIVAPRPAGGSH